MRRYLCFETWKELISYFFVGGSAAVVEWTEFFLLYNIFSVDYPLATVMSFVAATCANWIIGKKTTFKDTASGMEVRVEIAIIYAISGIGLLFNLVLMYLFVEIAAADAMLSKIMATGIVFLWNFIARKVFVYRT